MGSPGPGIAVVILYCLWASAAILAVALTATYLSIYWCVFTIVVALTVFALMVWKLTPIWRRL